MSGVSFQNRHPPKNAGCGSGWMNMTGKDDEDWFLFYWELDLCGERGLMMRNEGTLFVHYPSADLNFEKNWLSKGTPPGKMSR